MLRWPFAAELLLSVSINASITTALRRLVRGATAIETLCRRSYLVSEATKARLAKCAMLCVVVMCGPSHCWLRRGMCVATLGGYAPSIGCCCLVVASFIVRIPAWCGDVSCLCFVAPIGVAVSTYRACVALLRVTVSCGRFV